MSAPPAQPGTRTGAAAVRAPAATAAGDVAPATFTIFPSIVIGGQRLVPDPQGTLTVGSIASADRTVLIASSNPAVAVPAQATVTIPAGADRAAVEIVPELVSAISTATITVSGAGVSQSVDVTVYPPGATLPPPFIASIAASPLTVPAGTPSTATVTLVSPAPAGGLLVALFVNLPLTAQMQPTVVVPAGARTVSVPITTSIGFPDTTTTAEIRAAAGDGIVHSGINVSTGAVPMPFGIRSVALNPATVVGGNLVQGTITMTAAAPAGGAVVTLQSTDTTVATTPASVTVPAGTTTATFTVATSAVATASTANVAGGFGGGFLTTTLHVNPPAPSAPPVTTPPAGTAPAAPALASPAADARFAAGAPVAFDWSDVAGAAAYALQVSSTDKFTTFVVNQTTATSAFTAAGLPTSQLWWRVRAVSASGTAGAWSVARHFELK